MDYIAKSMIFQSHKSKLGNITEKLKFLPDNYDYQVPSDELLVAKNELFSLKNLYVFHTIGENYGAMTMLGAMLNNLKFDFKNTQTGETKKASM